LVIGEHRASGEKKNTISQLAVRMALRQLELDDQARGIWRAGPSTVEEELGSTFE